MIDATRRNRWIGGLAVAAVLALGAYSFWPRSPAPSAAGAPASGPIPKIDVHVHVAPSLAAQAVDILRENGIEIGLNASGGVPGGGLELSLRAMAETDGHLVPYCNFAFGHVEEPGFAEYTVETLTACKRRGAVGLKVFKALGLGIQSADGSLLAVDDPRLDVVFETAGRLGLPVLIHSGDPKAFFQPASADNERYDELRVHPSWSFSGERANGQPWPAWDVVVAQYERRVARHPRTTFVGAHFGNAPEEPARVARMLDRHPNLFIDTAARVPEIGRRPQAEMHAFFLRFRKRILFGSDLSVTTEGLTLGSGGERPSTRPEARPFFDRQWRYFETAGRRMPSPTPIQGRWSINGIDLPREVLEDVYWRNAARVFHLRMPTASRPTRVSGDGL